VSYPVNPWIRSFGFASAAPLQLVCFPHAGGTASYYRPMAKALAPYVEVLAIQYPGRLERYRESLVDNVDELADHVVGSLLPHLHRPTSLFGHSLGAAVAFEVAVRLEARGHQLRALFVSGRGTPSANRNDGIHELGDDRLAQELTRLGATDPDIITDDELLELLLPTIRADYKASETYLHRGGARTECPLVTLTGSDDPYVEISEADAWRGHARGEFELHELPGGHFFLDQQRDRILDIVRRRLAQPSLSPR
jgi:pyochelin biosynthesis protein PchC